MWMKAESLHSSVAWRIHMRDTTHLRVSEGEWPLWTCWSGPYELAVLVQVTLLYITLLYSRDSFLCVTDSYVFLILLCWPSIRLTEVGWPLWAWALGYIYIHVYVCVYLYVYIYLYIYMCIHTYIGIYIYIHMYDMHVYILAYIYTPVYIYIYLYIYMLTYIIIYMYVYVYRCLRK